MLSGALVALQLELLIHGPTNAETARTAQHSSYSNVEPREVGGGELRTFVFGGDTKERERNAQSRQHRHSDKDSFSDLVKRACSKP